MKKCPYCDELIQPDALKCRYCKEWLNDEEASKTKNTLFYENISPKEKECIQKTLKLSSHDEVYFIKAVEKYFKEEFLENIRKLKNEYSYSQNITLLLAKESNEALDALFKIYNIDS